MKPPIQWPSEPFFKATLPLPPSVNGSYQTNHNAQFHASDELKRFKDIAYYVIRQSSDKYSWDIIQAIRDSKTMIPLQWRLDIYFQRLWQRDATGPVKAAEDAVFSYIGINDNRVVRFVGEKFLDKDNPRFEMSVSVCIDRL